MPALAWIATLAVAAGAAGWFAARQAWWIRYRRGFGRVLDAHERLTRTEPRALSDAERSTLHALADALAARFALGALPPQVLDSFLDDKCLRAPSYAAEYGAVCTQLATRELGVWLDEVLADTPTQAGRAARKFVVAQLLRLLAWQARGVHVDPSAPTHVDAAPRRYRTVDSR